MRQSPATIGSRWNGAVAPPVPDPRRDDLQHRPAACEVQPGIRIREQPAVPEAGGLAFGVRAQMHDMRGAPARAFALCRREPVPPVHPIPQSQQDVAVARQHRAELLILKLVTGG